MTLLSFIFTSPPSRLNYEEEERVKEREKREEGDREGEKECKVPQTANLLQKASHWFWDGELMKPQPDMTVQCQTTKSYAGRRALAAIILQIVCVWGWQKWKQNKLKRNSLKRGRETNSQEHCRCIFGPMLSILMAVFTHSGSVSALILNKHSSYLLSVCHNWNELTVIRLDFSSDSVCCSGIPNVFKRDYSLQIHSVSFKWKIVKSYHNIILFLIRKKEMWPEGTARRLQCPAEGSKHIAIQNSRWAGKFNFCILLYIDGWQTQSCKQKQH